MGKYPGSKEGWAVLVAKSIHRSKSKAACWTKPTFTEAHSKGLWYTQISGNSYAFSWMTSGLVVTSSDDLIYWSNLMIESAPAERLPL